jgi:hypothetical protein
MDADLRESIMELACGSGGPTAPLRIENLDDLKRHWPDVSYAARCSISGLLATSPGLASQAVNFSAESSGPKMRVIAGRFVRGNQIFASGSWRAMSGEEARLFAAR